MLGIARDRRTAIRLGIYGGRALVQRDRVPLAARRAIWRTGRWHRERKGRHDPAKRRFIKWLLQAKLDTDFCIGRLAKEWKIDPRTLRSWMRKLGGRGAFEVLDEGYGRREGLRIRCNRAKLYALLSELDQGEHDLRDRRRRRYGFRWPRREANKRKPDHSPSPLLDRRNKDLQPFGSVLKTLFSPPDQETRRPPATRFEHRQPAPDALRAAVREGPWPKNERKTKKPDHGEQKQKPIQIKDPQLAAILERLHQKIIANTKGAKNADSKTASGATSAESSRVRAAPAILGTAQKPK